MKEVGTFFEQTKDAQKIVVIDFGFLGDTVHLLPALWEIRRNYPQASLHVVTTPVGGEVLKLAGCVDKIWAYELTNPSPRWYKSLGLVMKLRKERFDVLFNFSGADRTLYLGAALGIKNKMVQVPKRWHFYNSLLAKYWVPPVKLPSDASIYERRLGVLRMAGLHIEGPVSFFIISQNLLKEAKEWIYPGAIHLSPNTSSWAKEWPIARWVELIQMMRGLYPHQEFVISASRKSREVERVQSIVQKAGSSQLRVLPYGLSISHLAAVMSQCKLHIGCDSGPTHLAWALQLPTVTIYRQYPDMAQWTPKGSKHVQCTAPCKCFQTVCPECQQNQEAQCLAGIRAEEVFEKVKEMEFIQELHAG